jgi:hypothetical protein
MDHRIAISKLAREDGGVFVVRRHHGAEPGERDEVCRLGQRYQRAARREGRVGDDPGVQVFDPGEPGIFHAPGLFGEVNRIGSETGLRVDLPVRYAVVATRHGEVRMAAAVFDADQQDRLIASLASAGVEHRVRRIRPIAGGQNRVFGVAMEELGVERRGLGF